MKKSMKLLSVFLIVAMCIGFAPAAFAEAGSGAAAETAPTWIGVSTEAELIAAVKNVAEDGEVELEDDITLSAPLAIGKSLTLDLSEYTLRFANESQAYDSAITITEGDVRIIRGKIKAISGGDESGHGFENAVYVENASLKLARGIVVEAAGQAIVEGDKAHIVVHEGRFCSDISQYVDDWDVYTVTESDGVYTVSEKPEEEPAEQEPSVEEPSVEEPSVEEPSVEEPSVEEPSVEEPSAEEPSVEEPSVEEPSVEEPTVEEPTVEEPSAEQPEEPESVDTEAGLLAAIESLSEGDTLALEGDIKLKSLSLSKSLTLDLAGYTLTGDITVASGASVTVKGGSIVGTVENNGSLTLSDVSVTAASGLFDKLVSAVSGSGSVRVLSSGDLTLAGSTHIDGDVKLTAGSITVDDADVSAKNIKAEEGVSGNITAGMFEGVDPATLIGEGLELTNEGVKPAALATLPTVTSKDGKTRYDALDSANRSNRVVFDKDKDNLSKNTNFEFKLGEGAELDSIRVGSEPASGQIADFTGTALSTKDYSFNASSGLLTISKDAELFQKLDSVYNLIALRFKGFTAGNDTVYIPLYVYPDVTAPDSRFVKDSSDTVTFVLSDKPVDVSVSETAAKNSDITNGKKLTAGTDYEITENNGSYTVTVKASGLNSLSAGTRYIAFWFEAGYNRGVAFAYTLTVRPAPSLAPASRDWTYGSSDDVSFTVNAGNKAMDVKLNGTSLTAGQCSISNDGLTVTIKAGTLKGLVNTSTGAGHGANKFTVVTTDGEVTATVLIKPVMSAKDGKNTHTKGSSSDLVFTSTAPITGGVKVGTIALKSDEYSLSSDGMTLTIKASFLNARGAGNTFTLKASTAYGDVSASFKVTAGTGTNTSAGSPNTGDESNITVWVAVLALSGAAAIALMPKKKKQN